MAVDETEDPTTPEPDEAEVTKDIDEGAVEVHLGAERPADMPEEAFNLVPELLDSDEGREFLEDLCQRVIDEKDDAWESTADYRKYREEMYKLYTGQLDPKTEPFEDCANVHIPIVGTAMSMLQPRLVTQVFPGDDNILGVIPTGPEDQARADTLTLHGEWQFRVEMPDFIPQQEQVMTEMLLVGSAFCHSYRDTSRNRNRHDYMTCEEFYLPYVWRTTDPSLGDVPYKGRILRRYRYQLEEHERAGLYHDVARLWEEDDEGNITPVAKVDEDLTVRPTVDKAKGIDKPDDDNPRNPEFVLYEHHGYARLPGEDRERPIVVTVDPASEEVIGLFVREQDEWRDRARFQRQVNEYQIYAQALAQYQEAVRNPPPLPMMDPMAPPPPPPPPPQPPKWAQYDEESGEPLEPQPARKEPIEYFTHAVCQYDPHHSLGIGIGWQLFGFNQVANTITNQYIDTATINNDKPLVVPEGVFRESGDIDIHPGKILRANVPVEQMGNVVRELSYPPANPQMMEITKLIIDEAKQLASNPDVFAGAEGKANETYRGIATRVEQAIKPLTAIALRYLRFLTHVVQKNARLNSVFLPDEEFISVVDPTKGRQGIVVTRAMYEQDYDVTFTADTRFVSQAQQIDEAVQLEQMVITDQGFYQRIEGQQFLYEARVRRLKAMRRQDMIPFLGTRPQPPPPPQPMPPHEEDAQFLEGKFPQALPGDDDDAHIADHSAFMGAPEGQALAPESKKNMEQHVRNHIAQKIRKVAQAASPQPGGPNAAAA